MAEPPDFELKQFEERKREAHWDPVERWQIIQEMIDWADSQTKVRRNTRERCLQLQREKDQFFGQDKEDA
jgi:hypothetical protein